MANKQSLTREDMLIQEHESFIQEIEQSGIPLWVYYAYYYCTTTGQGGDDNPQLEDTDYLDDEPILGI